MVGASSFGSWNGHWNGGEHPPLMVSIVGIEDAVYCYSSIWDFYDSHAKALALHLQPPVLLMSDNDAESPFH